MQNAFEAYIHNSLLPFRATLGYSRIKIDHIADSLLKDAVLTVGVNLRLCLLLWGFLINQTWTTWIISWLKPGHRYSIQTPMLLAWYQIVARSRMRANKLGIPKNLVITAIPMFQGGFFQILPSTSVMFFSFQNFPNGKKILTVSCFTSQSFSELLEICGLSKILVWTSLLSSLY